MDFSEALQTNIQVGDNISYGVSSANIKYAKRRERASCTYINCGYLSNKFIFPPTLREPSLFNTISRHSFDTLVTGMHLQRLHICCGSTHLSSWSCCLLPVLIEVFHLGIWPRQKDFWRLKTWVRSRRDRCLICGVLWSSNKRSSLPLPSL